MDNKTKFVIVNAAIQAFFAIGFLCNKNPDLHACAIAPLLACVALLILKPKSSLG